MHCYKVVSTIDPIKYQCRDYICGGSRTYRGCYTAFTLEIAKSIGWSQKINNKKFTSITLAAEKL